MYEIIKYNTEEEWLKIRQQGIGGSDLAILLGASTYMSPLELWEDKRVGLGLSDNQLIFKPSVPTICAERGEALESVTLKAYQREEKCTVSNIEGVLRSKEYPFMQASLDGYVIYENKLVEIKTVSIFQEKEWGDPDDEQIPPNYYLQVQHYMIVTGFKACDVAVLFMSKDDLKIYRIQADPKTQKMIIEREKEFWDMVTNGIEPPTESRDISIKYAKSNGKSIEISPVIKCKYQQLLIVEAERKELEKEEKELKDEMKLYLENNDTLTDDGKILLTWKSSKSTNKLDTNALKEAHPDIYKKFTKEVEGSRRFLIKKEK